MGVKYFHTAFYTLTLQNWLGYIFTWISYLGNLLNATLEINPVRKGRVLTPPSLPAGRQEKGAEAF